MRVWFIKLQTVLRFLVYCWHKPHTIKRTSLFMLLYYKTTHVLSALHVENQYVMFQHISSVCYITCSFLTCISFRNTAQSCRNWIFKKLPHNKCHFLLPKVRNTPRIICWPTFVYFPYHKSTSVTNISLELLSHYYCHWVNNQYVGYMALKM